MKAVFIKEHGGPEVLTYGDLPEPVVGPNDVKVRVRACALNRVDVYTRMGVRGTRLSLGEPHILGGDVAGDIAEVGAEVTRVRVGDRVVVNPKLSCGQCQYCVAGEEEMCTSSRMLGSTAAGSYAEFVKVPAVNTVRLPDTVSYVEAASLPTVFLPSWNILIRRAALKPWETALILSASSGVGTAAIQVAKNVVGARVIATTSTDEKARKARELGADEVINYTREDIERRVKELTDNRGRKRRAGPRRRGLLARRLPRPCPRRPVWHLRRHHRLQGRSAAWAAVLFATRRSSGCSWAGRKTCARSSSWWPEGRSGASSTRPSRLRTRHGPTRSWSPADSSASWCSRCPRSVALRPLRDTLKLPAKGLFPSAHPGLGQTLSRTCALPYRSRRGSSFRNIVTANAPAAATSVTTKISPMAEARLERRASSSCSASSTPWGPAWPRVA